MEYLIETKIENYLKANNIDVYNKTVLLQYLLYYKECVSGIGVSQTVQLCPVHLLDNMLNHIYDDLTNIFNSHNLKYYDLIGNEYPSGIIYYRFKNNQERLIFVNELINEIKNEIKMK